MKRCLFIVGLLIASMSQTLAQDWYWVFYADKEQGDFDPYTYFDAKAIERRQLHGLSLNDPTDWPVNNEYVNAVSGLVEEMDFSSRWFNASAVFATTEQMAAVKTLPFVKEISAMPEEAMVLAETMVEDVVHPDGFNGLAVAQTENMGLSLFREKGIDGKGVRVAVFDAGFPGVDTHEAFEHIRTRNGIVKTYDFVKKKDFVYSYGSHGTNVLSCIAGKYGAIEIGLATGAEFLLARTEMSVREPFSEEKNWLAAAEWADKNGADVINSSLGYTYHRYFIWDMDGKKSLVARAANMAARKGMLVVNAAGNEGTDKSWKIIGTPADADSVLSVGGIDPWTNYHISFSSYGPTADGRMKPNVATYGYAITAKPKGGFSGSYGTSFASPLMAGFAACVKQVHADKKSMDLFAVIQQAGSLYPYFDYAHGYGMPHASRVLDHVAHQATFELQVNGATVQVKLNSLAQEPEAIGKVSTKAYLYYHIANVDGDIVRYEVVDMQEGLEYDIDVTEGQVLFVHYNGYSLKQTL